MVSYKNRDRLVILDADGTIIDSYNAIQLAFLRHGMDLGDAKRFQKRRKLFKYLGGIKEFPTNLRQQLGKQSRKRLLSTLTEIYRNEARLFPGIEALMRVLIQQPGVRLGIVTRNVTLEPEKTIRFLLERHGIDSTAFDYFACIPLGEPKLAYLRQARQSLDINPARSYACGDEYSDYVAAVGAGMHPFVASYGFEDEDRLLHKFGIPYEVISASPENMAARLLHALDLTVEAPE